MQQDVTQGATTVLEYLAKPLKALQEWLSPVLPGDEWAAYLAFALYVLIIIGGALGAVLSRNLIRAMLGLVMTFLGVAGMYLLLASPFLAFMQLLIYVGAVCVLIFFAVMLTRNTDGGEESRLPSLGQLFYGALAFLAPLAVAGPFIVMHAGRQALETPKTESTASLGAGLLGSYVLPFELISIILLVAMAGAVYLAFRGYAPKRGGEKT
ncbi:MAG: NADH-quinone oxidoreductase subunit J [Deltaproteobacteria bacterium]|jgi:NADH-quinone oxidoreductase subunit J|nr:NADH-quinone oxidoreductase subunit J [Deltaproteobacteria bacterium]